MGYAIFIASPVGEETYLINSLKYGPSCPILGTMGHCSPFCPTR